MRNSIALLALFGWVVCHGLTAINAVADEPVDPFAQPAPGRRVVTTNVSDEPDAEDRPGFSFPKLSLPKLPTPSLPKMELPKLQMPKFAMPQWSRPEPARNTEPSTWEKLNNSTKNAFTKTRDTLMPWAAKDEPPPPRHATGNRSSTGMTRSRVSSSRSSSESTPDKKSFFSSLFTSPESDDKPIETTNDFLSQRRPRFD